MSEVHSGVQLSNLQITAFDRFMASNGSFSKIDPSMGES
jgi:hypothetical protein